MKKELTVLLRKVEVEGFRCFRDKRVFEFKDGLNIIMGPVGSGKSSLFEAIEYGFFGTTFGLRRRAYRREDLVNVESNGLRVLVEFEVEDEGVYSVERIFTLDGGEKVHVRTPFGETFSKKSIVDEMLRELLGLDVFEYERSVSINHVFLFLLTYGSPSTRSRVIDSLLGIDAVYKIMRSLNVAEIRRRIKDIEGEAAYLRDRLSFLEERREGIERQIEKKLKEIDVKRRLLSEVKKDLEDVDRRLSEFKGLDEEYHKVRALYEILSREVAGREINVEEIVLELERIRVRLGRILNALLLADEAERLESVVIREDTIRDVIKLYREILEVAWKTYEEFSSNIKYLKGGLEKKQFLLQELEKRIIELEPDVEEYKRAEAELERFYKKYGDESTLRNEVERLGFELKRLEAKNALMICVSRIRRFLAKEVVKKKEVKCPVCGNKVSADFEKKFREDKKRESTENVEREIEDMKKRLEELKRVLKEIEELKVLMIEKEDKLDIYDELSKRREELLSEIQRLRSEINESEAKIREIGVELSRVEGGMKLVTENIHRLERIGEFENIKKKYSELSRKWAEYKQLIENKARLEETLRKIETEIKLLEKELAGLSSRDVLAEYSEVSQRLNEVEDELNRLRTLENLIQKVRNAYREVQTRLRMEKVNEISSFMRKVLAELYPYSDIEDVRLSVFERYDERKGRQSMYLIEAKIGSGWSVFSSKLSDGQKSFIMMALFLGFFKNIKHNAGFILLDEPLPNIDVVFKERVFSRIKDILGVRQVLLTTQSEDIASRLGDVNIIFLKRLE